MSRMTSFWWGEPRPGRNRPAPSGSADSAVRMVPDTRLAIRGRPDGVGACSESLHLDVVDRMLDRFGARPSIMDA